MVEAWLSAKSAEEASGQRLRKSYSLIPEASVDRTSC